MNLVYSFYSVMVSSFKGFRNTFQIAACTFFLSRYFPFLGRGIANVALTEQLIFRKWGCRKFNLSGFLELSEVILNQLAT